MGIHPSAFLLQQRRGQLHPPRASLSPLVAAAAAGPGPAAHLDLVRGRQHQSRHIWPPRGGVRSRAAKGKGHVRTGPPGALRAEASGRGKAVSGWPQTVQCGPGWPPPLGAQQSCALAGRGARGPGGLPGRRGIGEAGVLDSPHGALALREARAGSWEPARMGNKGQLQDLLQREMDRNRECPGLWWPSLGARRSGDRVFYLWKRNTTPV